MNVALLILSLKGYDVLGKIKFNKYYDVFFESGALVDLVIQRVSIMIPQF